MFNHTEQMPICSLFELLYAFRITELFLVACNDTTAAFGNRHLNILNSMRLPYAPESILFYNFF